MTNAMQITLFRKHSLAKNVLESHWRKQLRGDGNSPTINYGLKRVVSAEMTEVK